jgi:probable HAF family extracellular repeat protein
VLSIFETGNGRKHEIDIPNLHTAVSLLAAIATAQQRYTITDLKPLSGGNFSQAFSINNPGVIGGQSNITDITQRAVLWLKGRAAPIVIGPAGVNSGVFGVNERGQAELQLELSDKDPNTKNFCGYGTDRICRPFLWQNFLLTPLPLLGGNNGAVGGINTRGEISGWAESATMDPNCAPPQKLDFEAVVWGPKPGDLRRLRPLSGDTVSMSLWINDKGEAVGTSGTCANTGLLPLGHGAHAVLWHTDGSPVNIGMLDPTQEFGGIALGINNAGQVVGGASLADGSSHAFLWSSHTGTRKLSALPGDVSSGAVSINDRGDAVGRSFDPSGFPHPVIWPNGGDPKNLNDLAPGSPLLLLWPTMINARGEISGFGLQPMETLTAFSRFRTARNQNDAGPAADALRSVSGKRRTPIRRVTQEQSQNRAQRDAKRPLQKREEHWAIVDLVGKGGHIRTVHWH